MKRRRRENYSSHIRPKGKSWEVQYSSLNLDGKPERYSRSFSTKAEALEFAELCKQRRIRTNSAIRFESFALDCIDSRDNAPNTVTQRLSLLRNHILPYFGNITLASIKREQIEKFYRQMALAPSSKRSVRTLLNYIFNKAVDREIIFKNPAAGIVIRESQKVYRVLTENDIKEFLPFCSRSKFKFVYHLMLGNGLRRGEAFGVTWEAINFSKRYIMITRQVVMENNKCVIKDQLKNKWSRRKIPLNNDLLELLKTVPRADRHGLLTEKPNNFNTFGREFKRIMNLIHKSRSMRPHDLRHSFATIAQQKGISLSDLCKLLGHSTPNITAKIYLHNSSDYVQRSANIISKVLGENDD